MRFSEEDLEAIDSQIRDSGICGRCHRFVQDQLLSFFNPDPPYRLTYWCESCFDSVEVDDDSVEVDDDTEGSVIWESDEERLVSVPLDLVRDDASMRGSDTDASAASTFVLGANDVFTPPRSPNSVSN